MAFVPSRRARLAKVRRQGGGEEALGVDPDLAHERIYIRLLPLIKQSQKDSKGATPHSLSLSLSSATLSPTTLVLYYALLVLCRCILRLPFPFIPPQLDLNSVVPKQSFRPTPASTSNDDFSITSILDRSLSNSRQSLLFYFSFISSHSICSIKIICK